MSEWVPITNLLLVKSSSAASMASTWLVATSPALTSRFCWRVMRPRATGFDKNVNDCPRVNS